MNAGNPCAAGPHGRDCRRGDYDRLFAGIRFDELDGDLLYVAARYEECAAEIEDGFALHIAIIATAILKSHVEIVLVRPKVLQ